MGANLDNEDSSTKQHSSQEHLKSNLNRKLEKNQISIPLKRLQLTEKHEDVITGNLNKIKLRKKSSKRIPGYSRNNCESISKLDLKIFTSPETKENQLGKYKKKSKSGIETFLGYKKKSRKKLLTADEEKTYGKMVQKLLKIRSIELHLLNQNGNYPTSSELASIFNVDEPVLLHLKSACEEAYNRMIDRNIPLVIFISKKSQKKYSRVKLHDLVKAGINGLICAVEKFDPSKGYKLSTYAHWWIRQALNRYIMEQRLNKVPTYYSEWFSKIRKAQAALRDKLRRDPDLDEIGDLLGLEQSRIKKIINAFEHGPSKYWFRESEKDEFIDAQVQIKIEKFLGEVLSLKEAKIIRLSHGIDDGVAKSFDDISKRFKVPKDRVRQIETKAIRKLKLSKNWDKLNMDLGGLWEIGGDEPGRAKTIGSTKSS